MMPELEVLVASLKAIVEARGDRLVRIYPKGEDDA